jgi:glucose-1-phosphate adenylyltransferase
VFEEVGGRRAEAVDSLLCPGVVVSGGKVRRSILANRVFVDEGAVVEDSILFSGVHVGKNARLRRAIVDKWVRIPPGATIGHDPELDRSKFTVTESGIVVVPMDMAFESEPAPRARTPITTDPWP